MKKVGMNKIAKYLNQHIVGGVYDGERIRQRFMNDRSVLRLKPEMVAVPENVYDVCKILRFAHQVAGKGIELPITVRGNGMSRNGASLGGGLVMLMERMGGILEIDTRGRMVRVQAGVTLGELNKALALHGLWLPVAADERETIGGLIAGSPGDEMMGRYGGMTYFVEQAEVVLADGSFLQTGRRSERAVERSEGGSPFGNKVHRKMRKLILNNQRLIDGLPEEDLDLMGYRTVAHVRNKRNGSMDLLPLLFGSEGSLAVITEVILRCELLETRKVRVIVEVAEMAKGLEIVGILERMGAKRVRLLERRMFEKLEKFGKGGGSLVRNLHGDFVLVAEFGLRSGFRQMWTAKQMERLLPQQNCNFVVEDAKNSAGFDELERLWEFSLKAGKVERVDMFGEVRVPRERVVEFLERVKEMEGEMGMELIVWGSLLAGLFVVRPKLNFETTEGRMVAMRFLKDYGRMVMGIGGSLAGVSGEGRLKALLTLPELAVAERKLFDEIKEIFDPRGILNPEVKMGVDARKVIRRIGR